MPPRPPLRGPNLRSRSPHADRRARTHRGFAAVALSALVAGASIPAAPADPASSTQAQAAAIQDQLDANGARISALSEQYDGAQLRLEQAEQTIALATARIAAVGQERDQTRRLVTERAVVVYRETIAGRQLDGLDLSDARNLVRRSVYADALNAKDSALLRQLVADEATLARQHADAIRARADAAAEQATIHGAQQDLAAANARQAQLLAPVHGPLALAVSQESQRREATTTVAAQERYAAPTSTRAVPSSMPYQPRTGQPRSGSAAPGQAAVIALAFAHAQLGKPYVYAAAGPDAYDCSGLTMAAYAAAGITLPHYSGAQYARLPHVPLAQLRPGDLVFWGPGGSEHVGLYIGGGLMIHAPHTGAVVRIAPLFGTPVGAARV